MCESTDVAKNVYEVDQKLGGGELCLSACPGVGNRPPRKENIVNPRGCARGGAMVTVKIADTDKQHHREPAQSVCVADCYFIVNVLDLPFASPIAICR